MKRTFVYIRKNYGTYVRKEGSKLFLWNVPCYHDIARAKIDRNFFELLNFVTVRYRYRTGSVSGNSREFG